MNIEKHLILIKNNDKTSQINYCYYNNGMYTICFKNSDKEYRYNYSNVEWFKNPIEINTNRYMVYYKNQSLGNIMKLIDFDKYIRIIFNTGIQKIYLKTSIILEENCLTNSLSHTCFDYLKDLSENINGKNENDTNFLSKQYKKLVKISPRSVLATYLNKSDIKQSNDIIKTIFPFGFNISQKNATNMALNNQISIIEGPPGTGKTQTILNIIANAIINEKTVAVVSNNNSATSNVYEKLCKYDVGFIAAYLGNKNNKEEFFDNQDKTYPSMHNWNLSNDEIKQIEDELITSEQQLNQMLEYQNKVSKLKQELDAITIEYKYFNDYCKQSFKELIKLRSIIPLNADKVLTFIIKYEQNIKKGAIKFVTKLYNLFFYGIYNFGYYNISAEIIVASLQKNYYEKKIQELSNGIEQLTNKLTNYNFENEIEKYSKQSMKLFKSKLFKRYNKNENRPLFSKKDLWNNFSQFIKEYPVILSTTYSLRTCGSEDYLYDYVIIDEASQVDIVTGSLVLSCAKKAVIVGDLKQLPNVIDNITKEIAKKIYKQYNLESGYSYIDHSLLSSVITIFKNVPKTLLKEHYRCHSKIIGFCNTKFYDNELIILTKEQQNKQPLVLYKTVMGNHARDRINQRQIDVIFKEILPNIYMDTNNQSIGITSPFKDQINKIKELNNYNNIEVDTVHKYQGREKDIIILSTVENEISPTSFVDNENLINVAVSRAVNQLIVIVSDGCEKCQGTNIGDLVNYIKYNNFEIIESKIYSVFDLLYSSYSKKLFDILKNNKKISEYNSENLMYIVIEKVLNNKFFQHLNCIVHQPLKMLIKDPILLTENECKYAMNILTHIDFLIYNKLDKIPILAIEVDGYAFHNKNPIQLKRDSMKDVILKKYNIPIIRFNTTESNVEERLYNKLLGVLEK